QPIAWTRRPRLRIAYGVYSGPVARRSVTRGRGRAAPVVSVAGARRYGSPVVRLLSLSGFFFFSSRRRHTRSKRDWSSDVCSSDLHEIYQLPVWLYRVKPVIGIFRDAFHLQSSRRFVGIP